MYSLIYCMCFSLTFLRCFPVWKIHFLYTYFKHLTAPPQVKKCLQLESRPGLQDILIWDFRVLLVSAGWENCYNSSWQCFVCRNWINAKSDAYKLLTWCFYMSLKHTMCDGLFWKNHDCILLALVVYRIFNISHVKWHVLPDLAYAVRFLAHFP
jgi:hypothetical protein